MPSAQSLDRAQTGGGIASAPASVAIIGHPLAAEENRMAFRGWQRLGPQLVLPATWKARSLGHEYRHGPAGPEEPPQHALPVYGSGRNSLFLWRGLGPLLDRLRPDAIYCWEEPWSLAALQVSRHAVRLGIPMAFYSAENRPKRLPWPFPAVMSAVFRAAAACIAPTREIADTVRAAGFSGSIAEIPLWIRPRARVRADPAGRLLAYVGRLIPLKRVDLLVGSLARLPGWRLRIIGDGPERGRLASLARELGVDGRVEFLGHVDNGELGGRLDGASLLVLPTGENPRQAEQFGKAALEGVACGLPVLASRTGNLAALARSVPTLSARDMDTPVQLAEAIEELTAAYPDGPSLEASRLQVQEMYGPAAAALRLEAAMASLMGKAAP